MYLDNIFHDLGVCLPGDRSFQISTLGTRVTHTLFFLLSYFLPTQHLTQAYTTYILDKHSHHPDPVIHKPHQSICPPKYSPTNVSITQSNLKRLPHPATLTLYTPFFPVNNHTFFSFPTGSRLNNTSSPTFHFPNKTPPRLTSTTSIPPILATKSNPPFVTLNPSGHPASTTWTNRLLLTRGTLKSMSNAYTLRMELSHVVTGREEVELLSAMYNVRLSGERANPLGARTSLFVRARRARDVTLK